MCADHRPRRRAPTLAMRPATGGTWDTCGFAPPACHPSGPRERANIEPASLDSHMSAYSRRDFLATSSVALAGAALGFRSRPLGAQILRSRQPVGSLLPDVIDPSQLRQL